MVTNFNIPADDSVAQRARLLKEEIGGTWSDVFEELVATAEAVEEAREDDRKALSLVAEELANQPEQQEIRRREAEIVAGPEEATSDGGGETAGGTTATEDTPTPDVYAEPSWTIEELVEVGAEVMPGTGDKLQQRRDALKASLQYLQDNDRATPKELQKAVYHNGLDGEYANERSWWKNCIYKALAEIATETEAIRKADQSGEWRWVEE